jgi:hypothetical protein
VEIVPPDDAGARAAEAAWALVAEGSLDAARIASLFDTAGLATESAPWHAEAARRAHAEGRHAEVVAHIGGVIDGALEPEEHASLHLLAVGVLEARGDLAGSLDAAQRAFARAPARSEPWFRGAAAMIVNAWRLGRHDALQGAAAALDAALRAEAGDARVFGLSSAVLPLLRAGQVALAGMVLARMESVPAEERPRDGEARLHAARALRAGFEGDPWRFREDSEAAARGYRRLDEARLAMIHETNAAFGATQLGQGEHASALLRAVRDEATGLGLLRAVAVATHNLGPARLLCGDVEGALAAERDAVVMADVLGDPALGAMSRAYLARITLWAGDPRESLRLADEALTGMGANPGGRVFVWATRARARLTQDDPVGAAEDLRRADETLALLGAVEEGESELRLARAELASARGEPKADARWDEARAWLGTRAARLPEALREGFLAHVPEHAAIARGPHRPWRDTLRALP